MKKRQSKRTPERPASHSQQSKQSTTLNTISQRLQSLEDNYQTQLGENGAIPANIAEMEKSMTDLRHKLFGNGEVGYLERIRIMEERQGVNADTLDRIEKKISEWQKFKIDKILYILGLATSLAIAFLKG